MNSLKLVVALPIAAVLSACATPNAATFSSADLTSVGATVDTVAALANTGAGTMPTTGTASYTGNLVAKETDEGIIGDLSLTADFAANTITGSATNLNIIGSEDVEDQRLGGSLDVAGNISGSSMTADMTGSLTGVVVASGIGVNVGLDADLDLTGDFKSNTNPADQIAGSITGVIDVSAPGGQGGTMNVSVGEFATCVGGC